jgi:hypothetical protein
MQTRSFSQETKSFSRGKKSLDSYHSLMKTYKNLRSEAIQTNCGIVVIGLPESGGAEKKNKKKSILFGMF